MSVTRSSISVLYTDDEPSLLMLAKEYLKQDPVFALDIANSAEETLAFLQTKAYDCVVSDYQMPVTDGIELLRQIRSRYPDLPFIIFTGKGREEVVIQAFDAGADYYVQKGGDIRSQFRELSHKIKRAVEKRHIEQALKASEERYRNVVEDQTELICRFRPDGTHNFVNEAYCRYFQKEKDQIIGHRFIPDIPKEDQGTVRSHFASLTKENPTAIVEHQLILPNGSVRWQRWSDRAIYDAAGTLVEYQSVGRDITDRKTAELDLQKMNEETCAAYEQLTAVEEELRSSYDKLAKSQQTLETKELTLNAIIEESPIPQFVIDHNHTLLYWNHALAVYSGITAEEVMGTDQQWRAFYPSKRPCLADLLVDNAADRIPEWYLNKYEKSGLINDAYAATDFFPHMGKGGKWLYFTAGLVRDRNGEIIGAVESLEDITKQKTAELDLRRKNDELHAAYEQLTAVEEELRTNLEDLAKSQQALRESEERYRNVVEDQAEFICRFRPDGTHIFVNTAYCRFFAKAREEIIGKKFRPAMPAEDQARVKEHLAALTRVHPVATITQRIIMPDGSVRWQEWSDRAIFDDEGDITEYQSVGRDITAERRAEDVLRLARDDSAG